MNTSNTIQICGWWGSANIGDRYQPLIIAKHLLAKNIPFSAMGYHPIKEASHVQKYPDISEIKELTIHSPNPEIISDYIVAVTGSLSDYSCSTALLKNVVQQNTKFKKMIIWGGFQDVVFDSPQYNIANWQWLTDPRILFIARSAQELQCLRRLTGVKKIGIMGGDPMCNWVPLDHKIKYNPLGKRAIIISETWKHLCPELLPKLIEMITQDTTWKIGCFDGYADLALRQLYKFELIKNPSHFLSWLDDTCGLVSTRLHAAVLASVANLPTLAIGSNEKFDAVGLYATNLGGLFPVIPAKNLLADIKQITGFNTMKEDITQQYLATSRQTLALIPELLLG